MTQSQAGQQGSRRRRTSVEASLKIGRESEDHDGQQPKSPSDKAEARRQKDLEWVESLSAEQLLIECHRRNIELPANGGNATTRRARLRNYVREHGRTLPRKPKVQTPPPTPVVEVSEDEVPPTTGKEPDMTQPSKPSGPDAGQVQVEKDVLQPPPKNGSDTTPPTPPTPPVQTTAAQQPPAQQPAAAAQSSNNWLWPAVAALAIIGLTIVGLVFALRYNSDGNGATAISVAGTGSTGSGQPQAPANNGANTATDNRGNQTGDNSLPVGKCEWLHNHFPQTTAGVQALGAKLASVPQQRIATHLYPCDSSNTVFDGFIVLGPGEGYPGSFTIAVPDHGAVDSYPGATFTGDNHRIGAETIRATSGKVTAVRATYWPWLDENPPSAQTVNTQNAAPQATAVQTAQPAATQQPSGNVTAPQCVDPTTLASSHGWTNLGWGDQKYGGLKVQLSSSDTLPDKWEALTTGGGIHESDANRQLTPGTWTIYPPFSCRDALGYSK